MQESHHSISMSGGKYTWDDFDKDAKRANMNRSQFVQYLYMRFKENNKQINTRIKEIIMFLLMAMILLLLFIKI